jgi:CDP-diacylglycerol--serine O-phosphatidyltransferase
MTPPTPQISMFKQFLSPPNWYTAASIFCGFYSIVLSLGAHGATANSDLYQAGLLVGFAGLFDALDGQVARITGTSSPFGTQLDSFADVLSFGVAPAALLYTLCLRDLGVLGLAAAFVLLICGIFRLARFNCGAASGDESDGSRGLTITMGGGFIAAVGMLLALLDVPAERVGWQAAALLVGVGGLMVSNIRYVGIKNATRTTWAVIGAIVVTATVVAVVSDISYAVVPLMVLYVLSGPVMALVKRPAAT